MPNIKLTTKGKLPKRVHTLVLKMLESITAEAKMFNQSSFPSPELDPTTGRTVCRTPFCSAGFLIKAHSETLFKRLLKRDVDPSGSSAEWEVEAAELLGLDPAAYFTLPDGRETRELWTLFSSAGSWPTEYANQYAKARGPNGRAKVAVARWKAWLAAEGQESPAVFARD